MKTPLAIIFNDTHLKPGNEEEVLISVQHMVEYAVENKIANIIFAGDLFDSRSNQRLSCLLACNEILSIISNSGLNLYMFPGNHDKTRYDSFDSFLKMYRHYPNVYYNSDIDNITIDGVKITLLPFFQDDILIPMIEAHSGADVLISHFGMNGSTHLGFVNETSNISRKMLKKWDKVYLGHYHNTHEISKNIIHLPSLRPMSFGEDNNKGFSILYDDLSYKIIEGKFNKYLKFGIDLGKDDSQIISALIKTYRNSDDIIRFEIIGTDSQLKSLDKSQFADTGIDVKINFEDKYDYTQNEKPTLIKSYSKDQIFEDFKEFCNSKSYDMNYGLILLNNFFNGE